MSRNLWIRVVGWMAMLAAVVAVLSACASTNATFDLQAPGQLAASAGDAQVVLQWQYSGSQPISYTVYRSPMFSDLGEAITTGLSTTTFTDSTVENGRSYTYRVTAVNQNGAESDPSDAVTATPSVATFDGTLFDPPDGKGEWLEGLATGPYDVMDGFGGVVGRKLYVIGGKNSSGYLKSTAIYDTENDSWSLGAPLPQEYPAVEDAAAISLGDEIYVFGGGTAWNGGARNEAAVYDAVLDRWTMLPPMPTPRLGATAVQLDGLAYVIGGMDSSGNSLSSMDVFDLSSSTWISGPHPAMMIARDNAASGAMFGRIFVFGGRTRDGTGLQTLPTLQSVEQFDPDTQTWSEVAPMPTGRRAMNAVPMHGRILVLGGEATSDGGTFPEVEEYDPIHDSWRSLAPMPAGRHGAVAGRVGGQMFVATGGVVASDSFTSEVVSFRYEPSAPDLQEDLSTLSWQSMADAPTGKVEAQGTSHEGYLYTFGGFISWDPYRTTHESARFDPVSNTWTQLSDMAQAWTHAGTVKLGNHFLFAGGYLNPNDRNEDERDGLPYGESTVLRYDVDADAWFADIPLLPEPRGAGGFVRMGRNLHFFNGNRSDLVDVTDHWILSLDQMAQGWQRVAPGPSPRNHLSAVVQDDMIYLIGGQTGHREHATHHADVFRYDPVTDAWTSLASMPTPLSHHGNMTFSDSNYILVFGGEVGHNNYTSSILRYSIEEDTWSYVGTLPSERSSAVAGYIGGTFYVATGTGFSRDTLQAVP